MRDRARDGAQRGRGALPARDPRGVQRGGLRGRASRGGHPLPARGRPRGGGARGKGAGQPRQLRRQEALRGAGVQRRRLRRGARAPPRGLLPAGPALPRAGARAPDRHQPRIPQRPHSQPLRGHAARDGGERARVPPHRRGERVPRPHPLDEGLQSQGDDPGLPPARRPDGGGGHALPAPPRRDRGRGRRGRPHQERDRHRLAAAGRTRRHHPRLPDGGQRVRDPGRPRDRGQGDAPVGGARGPGRRGAGPRGPLPLRAPRARGGRPGRRLPDGVRPAPARDRAARCGGRLGAPGGLAARPGAGGHAGGGAAGAGPRRRRPGPALRRGGERPAGELPRAGRGPGAHARRAAAAARAEPRPHRDRARLPGRGGAGPRGAPRSRRRTDSSWRRE